MPSHSNKANTYNEAFFVAFCSIIGFIVFFSALYRAATTGITYDEAYTYTEYVEKIEQNSASTILSDSVANNHLLNTYLIKAIETITKKKFDELTIRLPNLIFYVLFLLTSYFIARKKRDGFMIYSALVLNYYLHEYFGLGRGYGIATSLVLASLYFFDRWQPDQENNEKSLLAGIGLLTLASSANTISLLILAPIAFSASIYLIQNKALLRFTRKNLHPLIVLALFNGFFLYYHFLISESGKPLTNSGKGFYESIIIGYIQMFFSSKESIQLIVSLLICSIFLGAIAVKRKKITNYFFILSFLLFLGGIWLSDFFFHKGYPSLRVLLPSFPLLVIALNQCWVILKERIKNKFPQAGFSNVYKATQVFLVIILIVLFVRKYDLSTTRDFHDQYAMRDIALRTLVEGKKTDAEAIDKWSAEREFYVLKFIYLYDEDIRTYP